MHDHPEIRRVSFADQVHAATSETRKTDPDRAARMLGAVTQLDPLHKIQASFDALARTAQRYRDGIPDEYGYPLSYHADEAKGHVRYYRDVLKAAYEAAESMLTDMDKQLTSLEKTMSRDRGHDKPPELTTDGTPHPLTEGGYDPKTDPGLPGNISDVEALKEGKATPAQVEALASADAKGADGHSHTPTDADGFAKDDSASPAKTPTVPASVSTAAPSKSATDHDSKSPKPSTPPKK